MQHYNWLLPICVLVVALGVAWIILRITGMRDNRPGDG